MPVGAICPWKLIATEFEVLHRVPTRLTGRPSGATLRMRMSCVAVALTDIEPRLSEPLTAFVGGNPIVTSESPMPASRMLVVVSGSLRSPLILPESLTVPANVPALRTTFWFSLASVVLACTLSRSSSSTLLAPAGGTRSALPARRESEIAISVTSRVALVYLQVRAGRRCPAPGRMCPRGTRILRI